MWGFEVKSNHLTTTPHTSSVMSGCYILPTKLVPSSPRVPWFGRIHATSCSASFTTGTQGRNNHPGWWARRQVLLTVSFWLSSLTHFSGSKGFSVLWFPCIKGLKQQNVALTVQRVTPMFLLSAAASVPLRVCGVGDALNRFLGGPECTMDSADVKQILAVWFWPSNCREHCRPCCLQQQGTILGAKAQCPSSRRACWLCYLHQDEVFRTLAKLNHNYLLEYCISVCAFFLGVFQVFISSGTLGGILSFAL